MSKKLHGLQHRSVLKHGACMLSCFSHVKLFLTSWTVAHQAPPSIRFSRQCWSELPCPPPRDLPNPGLDTESLSSPALAGRFFTTSGTWEDPVKWRHHYKVHLSVRHALTDRAALMRRSPKWLIVHTQQPRLWRPPPYGSPGAICNIHPQH